MRERNSLKWGGTILGVILLAVLVAYAGTSSGNLKFTNTQRLRPDGNSEPEIYIAANGTMGIVGLSWLNFGTNLWTDAFGSTPEERRFWRDGIYDQIWEVMSLQGSLSIECVSWCRSAWQA